MRHFHIVLVQLWLSEYDRSIHQKWWKPTNTTTVNKQGRYQLINNINKNNSNITLQLTNGADTN